MSGELLPLKFYAKRKEVFLSDYIRPEHSSSKLICVATSNRLAAKIAATMNLMESRKQKAHEVAMCGSGQRRG